MKVLHVIPSISRNTGGPSRSVQGLVVGLNIAGVEAWLLTLRHSEEPWVDGISHFVNGEPFESAVDRIKPDIVHLHGIWSLALHRCALICRRLKIPYVIAPRGMLEPWSLKQKWLKKRLARWLYQDRDLKGSAALHATAESEAEQFKKLGFKNPVIVSPNGVNVPSFDIGNKQSALELQLKTRTNADARRILFVSRMHPKKGVLELVEAWSALHNSTCSICSLDADSSGVALAKAATWLKNWNVELVYTVSGEFEKDYEAKVKSRVAELALQDQFIFTGALNDEEKWKAYARADLFVLPTYSENFGIVVAEALWAGVPVITTKGTPWKELEERKCGWWIDAGVNPLVAALKDAISLSDTERHEMGSLGKRLINEKYTWVAVVKSMVAGYEEIVAERLG